MGCSQNYEPLSTLIRGTTKVKKKLNEEVMCWGLDRKPTRLANSVGVHVYDMTLGRSCSASYIVYACQNLK